MPLFTGGRASASVVLDGCATLGDHSSSVGVSSICREQGGESIFARRASRFWRCFSVSTGLKAEGFGEFELDCSAALTFGSLGDDTRSGGGDSGEAAADDDLRIDRPKEGREGKLGI